MSEYEEIYKDHLIDYTPMSAGGEKFSRCWKIWRGEFRDQANFVGQYSSPDFVTESQAAELGLASARTYIDER
ncbi:hypothetical protein JAO10_32985 [Burkholderia contaminans]|uniref:hypothetical protein n=1 Tax=Burkholderia contaminans TaxID=488447 RepID=UPI0018DD842B|nr:hypothetical protein [Burkholderia contaminans]MBH9725147.1 hypothetical protein [Burkholderia contaminans]